MPRAPRTLLALGVLLTVLALGATVGAARADAAIRLAALPPTFASPTWIGSAPGSRAMYVAERRGVVKRIWRGRASTYLDLRGAVGPTSGELGLLSVAFHADFPRDPRMFLYFTRSTTVGEIRSFVIRGGRPVSGSGRTVRTIRLSPPAATNHNGGQLAFLPDGTLLLGVGDGGGAGDPRGNAQNRTNPMGMLLAMIPRRQGGWLVPPGNPYRGSSFFDQGIVAVGLRNPWRMSLDEPTGDLWIADVGQDAREEVDVLVDAADGISGIPNFGWPRVEGTSFFRTSQRLAPGTRYVRPALSLPHGARRCSITGGVVYRGASIPGIRGLYLYADFCDSRVHGWRPSTGSTPVFAGAPGIVSFGLSSSGEAYAVSLQTGRAYRLVD